MKQLKKFNENIKEDIENIFIDFKDKYEIHNDVYINHFNIRGNEGFSINFIINSKIILKIEKAFIDTGFYGGFSYETRHKFEDFVKKEVKSSDEFQEAMDRVEEIGYKFDKISVYFDNDNNDESIAETTILFNKIKNKKILENLSNKSQLFSELESISFILEDEGFRVNIQDPKIARTVGVMLDDEIDYVFIEIKLKNKPISTPFFGTNVTGYIGDPNGNRAYDVLSNSEILEEYIDRVEEIASNHGYKIQKIRKNIGPFHILIEKI